jgi:7-cyano-7-deazaguanine synthase
MISKSVCVLMSGGVDSAILLGRALLRFQKVSPVYVRSGLAWEKAELHWLKKMLAAMARPGLSRLVVLEAPLSDVAPGHWGLTRRGTPGARSQDAAVYIPGRNISLIGKAALFCAQKGIGKIWLGTLAANPFPDATPAFFASFSRALSLGLAKRIGIEAPFARLTKKDILAFASDVPLHLAFSCLSPRGVRPCGRCNKCEEKRRALRHWRPPSQ